MTLYLKFVLEFYGKVIFATRNESWEDVNWRIIKNKLSINKIGLLVTIEMLHENIFPGEFIVTENIFFVRY